MNAGILLIGLLVLSQAEPSAAESPRVGDDVRRLVRQLNDGDAHVRQQAEDALVKLGPEIVSLLPPDTPQTPAEVKVRLARVRKALEQVLSESASRPSLVTLRGTMPFADAAAAIERQTGNKLVGYADRSGEVTADFERTPFWQALDQLLDEAGLTINPLAGESAALVLIARPESYRPRMSRGVYQGVFRFEALRVEARRDLQNPAVDSLLLTIGAAWEPRVRPIALQQPLDALRVVNDRDESMALATKGGSLDVGVQHGMTGVELRVPLELPDREVREIASLRGQLIAVLPGKAETFEFADLETARDVEQRRAGVAVTLERVRKNGDLFETRLNLRFDDASNALESHRNWVYGNPAYLLDAAGNKLENLGLQETRRRENEVGVAYLFDAAQGLTGCRLVYQTAASILQVPLDYELVNIPLP